MHIRIQKRKILSTSVVIALVLQAMLIWVTPVSADTITVPGDYGTIQDAINAANPGDTINVAAGTYTEDLTIQNKTGITLRSATGKDNTTIQLIDGVGIDIEGTASNFTLGGAANQGFTILSGGATAFDIQLANAPSGVTISYNKINTTGNASMGISIGAAGATGLTISNNEFIAEVSDGSIWGPKMVSVTVSSNTFTGPGGVTSGYAVQFAGVTGTSNINGNTITGYGMGVVIGHGEGTSELTIDSNSISGCNNGIRFVEYSPSTDGDMTTVTVTKNIVSTNAIGLRIGDGAHIKASNFVIENNSFSGDNTSYGLKNEHSSEVVEAEANWWGSATGPTHASNTGGTGDTISDNVRYSPWWAVSYLTGSPPNIALSSHPWTWHLNNSTGGGIQDAIDQASSGDALKAYPATYTEDLNIDEEITLTGVDASWNDNWTVDTAGAGGTAPTITYAATAHMIHINANNVTMQGFNIDTNNNASRGIWFDNIDSPTIQYCSFMANQTGSGDRCISLSDGYVATNFTISYCAFSGVIGDPMNWFAIGENGGCSGTNILSYNTINGLTSPLFLGSNNIYDITYANNSFTNNADGIYLHKPGAGGGSYGDIVLQENTFAGGSTADYAFLILSTVADTDFEGGSFTTGDIRLRYNNFLIMPTDGTATYKTVQCSIPSPTNSLDAEFNYWSSIYGPTHEANPQPGTRGADASDDVDYQPWLSQSSHRYLSTGNGYTLDATNGSNTMVIQTGTGTPYIIVGRYSENPGTTPTFMVLGEYFIDVVITQPPTNVTQIEIRYYYTDDEIVELDEQSLKLRWWNGASWVTCSDSGADTSNNYVWAKITSGTTPTLSQLIDTPFSAGGNRIVIPSLSWWGAVIMGVLFAICIGWVIRKKKLAVVVKD